MSSAPERQVFHLAEDPAPYEPEGLYRQHHGWLLRLLRRRFGGDAAEDLAQEAFLRLAARPVSLLNPRAFLARVAINAGRDQVRRRQVREAYEAAHPPVSETAAPQAEALFLKETILALPPKLREVFVLSRFGGLTYEEIARRCGISVKTVEARMTQALRTCAARIDPS